MFDDLYLLYERANAHRQEHSCGGYPYSHGSKLAEIVKKYEPKTILEVGTAIGYTAICMAKSYPKAQITTIEFDELHVQLALEEAKTFKVEDRIEFINADAREHLLKINDRFDLIFFDAYDVKQKFLDEFNRLSHNKTILINANIWERTTAEKKYLVNLYLDWEELDRFDDTIVFKRK